MLLKIFKFLLLLLPWFFSSLFKYDYNFYNEINLPFFAPKPLFYQIAWPLIYIFISISIYKILNDNKYKDLPFSYKITLLINYIFNQSYPYVFFNAKNIFYSFIITIGTFISLLFFHNETESINQKNAKYLIPYILLSLFAVILSFSIIILNS